MTSRSVLYPATHWSRDRAPACCGWWPSTATSSHNLNSDRGNFGPPLSGNILQEKVTEGECIHLDSILVYMTIIIKIDVFTLSCRPKFFPRVHQIVSRVGAQGLWLHELQAQSRSCIDCTRKRTRTRCPWCRVAVRVFYLFCRRPL